MTEVRMSFLTFKVLIKEWISIIRIHRLTNIRVLPRIMLLSILTEKKLVCLCNIRWLKNLLHCVNIPNRTSWHALRLDVLYVETCGTSRLRIKMS